MDWTQWLVVIERIGIASAILIFLGFITVKLVWPFVTEKLWGFIVDLQNQSVKDRERFLTIIEDYRKVTEGLVEAVHQDSEQNRISHEEQRLAQKETLDAVSKLTISLAELQKAQNPASGAKRRNAT